MAYFLLKDCLLPIPIIFLVFHFNSFSLHNHGIKDYYVPSFEAGGFTETDSGKIIMPLSVTVHHAATDGYHLKVFFEELQRTMNDPGEWL